MFDFKVKAISPLVSRIKVEGELAGFVAWNPADNSYTSIDAQGNVILTHCSFLPAVRVVVSNSVAVVVSNS